MKEKTVEEYIKHLKTQQEEQIEEYIKHLVSIKAAKYDESEIVKVDARKDWVTLTVEQHINGFVINQLLNSGFTVNSIEYKELDRFNITLMLPDIMTRRKF